MSIVSIPEARRAVGWNGDKDAELQLLIDLAEGTLETETKRRWAAFTDEVRWFTPGSDWSVSKFLARPLSSVNAVAVDAKEDVFPTADEIDVIWSEAGYVTIDPSDILADQYVAVQYSGGYSNDDAPRAVKAALLSQVKFLALVEDRDVIATRFRSTDRGGSTSLSGSPMSPQFRQFVEAKRRGFF